MNNKKEAIVYVHGKGGSAAEAEHYRGLFPNADVIGLDYKAETPWEAIPEFQKAVDKILADHESLTLVANSIGAFFSINALSEKPIKQAFLISPMVNLEKLIMDMMLWAGVTEAQLKEAGTIETSFGETLSWEYLTWVREHPIKWDKPTKIIYGSKDHLQSIETVKEFADKTRAELAVMEGGEHWFHTEEQMAFVDAVIRNCE